ncbi:unnamed protein product [Chrysoparadoxa australica]
MQQLSELQEVRSASWHLESRVQDLELALQEERRNSEGVAMVVERMEEDKKALLAGLKREESLKEERRLEHAEEVRHLKGMIAQGRAAMEAKAREDERAAAGISRREREWEAVLQQKCAVEEKLRDATMKFERQRAQMMEYKQRLDSAESQVQRVKAENSTLDIENSELRHSLELATARVRSMEDPEELVQRSRARVSALTTELEEERAERAVLRKACLTKDEQLVSLRAELNIAQSRGSDEEALASLRMALRESEHNAESNERKVQKIQRQLDLERKKRMQWDQVRREMIEQIATEGSRLGGDLEQIAAIGD